MRNEKMNAVTEKMIAFHMLAESNMALNQSLLEGIKKVHKNDELSDPKRQVLMTVHRHGPQTVPQIARKKKFSRQHILNLVNEFVADGYIDLVKNPDHKTSKLIQLTAKGLQAIEKMNEFETEIFSRLEINVSIEEMNQAKDTMNKIQRIFESSHWNDLMDEFNR